MNDTTATPDVHADVDAHADASPYTRSAPIVLGDYSFTVRPMKVAQLFPFLKLARPLFAALVARPSSPPSGLPPTAAGPDQGGNPIDPASLGATVEAAMADVDWLFDLLETHGPSVVQALAVGIEPEPAKLTATAAQIGDLTLVDLVVLLKHFIVVNAGFFVERGITLPPSPFALASVAVPTPPTS